MMQRWQAFRCSSLGHVLGLNVDCDEDKVILTVAVEQPQPVSGLHALERRLALRLHRSASPRMTWLMRRSTELASGQVALPIAIALVGREIQRNRIKSARVISIVWTGGLLLHVTIKLIARRKRPALFPVLTRAGGYSLPSGHTVTAVVTYGLAAWTVRRYLPESLRWFPTTIAIVIVTATGASRVYLGVHYPTDVFAGALIGAVWLAGSLRMLTEIEAQYGRRFSRRRLGLA